jgi:hypothetical protein
VPKKTNFENITIEPDPLPLDGTVAHEYLRAVEVNILDKYHQSLPFWPIDPRRSVYAALLAIDSFAVTMAEISKKTNSVKSFQYVSLMHEGISIGMRWLYKRLSDQPELYTANEEIISKAGEFFVHATEYARLEALHIALNKGLYTVTADADAKKIRFTRRHDLATPMSVLHYADLLAPTRERNKFRHKRLMSEAHDVIASIKPKLEDGRIHYSCVVDKITESMCELCSQLHPPEIVDLSHDVSMGKFTYEEFRKYWRVLHTWSTIALQLYLRLWKEGVSQDECMSTQVVPKDHFYACIARLATLDIDKVRAIAEFLTYDRRTQRPDIFLQPLFDFDDAIVWPVLVVTQSRQPRNALKLICRTPSSADAGASINGSREPGLLRRFGLHLQKRRNYNYKIGTNVSSEQDRTDVDLLAHRPAEPSEVLLVQGKTPIAASEPNEIDSVTGEIQFAANQCQRAETILRSMPIAQKQKLFRFVPWDLVTDYYSIVITPDSEPHGKYDNKVVPAISLVAFESRLKGSNLDSPNAIYEACRARAWQESMASPKVAYETMVIADVRYELPLYLDKLDESDITED